MDAVADPSPTPGETLEQPSNPYIAAIGQFLCVALPIIIWFVPLDLEPQTQHAFAIVAFMVVAWITQAMDYALAGFIGCFLFWALGVVRFPVAFSGFANDTSWFLFGALLIGAIAMRSGVARRLAYIVLLRIGITYPRILLGLIITDFLLTFVVPSGIARVVIMAAIALGPRPSMGGMQAGLAGNLCRCTGYSAIYRAIADAGRRPLVGPAQKNATFERRARRAR